MNQPQIIVGESYQNVWARAILELKKERMGVMEFGSSN